MSDEAITCPKCGSSVPAGDRFCTNCGHIMQEPQDPSNNDEPRSTMGNPPDPTRDTGVTPVSYASTEGDGSQHDSSPLPAPVSDVPGTVDSPPVGPFPDAIAGTDDQPGAPDTWYQSLSSSPGGALTTPDGDPLDTSSAANLGQPDSGSQGTLTSTPLESEYEGGARIYYAPSPASSPDLAQWQPGVYDPGATQAVNITPPLEPPPAPHYGAAPTLGQTQSIFAPPTSTEGTPSGQPAATITPQQGYAPPTQGFPPQGTQGNQPQYPPPYVYPQQTATPKDPTTALMLELLGYLGFLGIGHIYAGKTNRGIGLLIGWLLYLTASVVLTFCLVGCFMFIAWLFVPAASGIWIKNEMEKERLMGIRF